MSFKSFWHSFIFVLTFICFGTTSFADEYCYRVYSKSTTDFKVGFGKTFGPFVAHEPVFSGQQIIALDTGLLENKANPSVQGRQRENMWCWAACTQMALNFHGFRILQEEIVIKAFGMLVNRPGNLALVKKALAGWIVRSPVDGLNYVSRAEHVRIDFLEMKNYLEVFQKPMIYAINGVGAHGTTVGHAVIVTGVTFDINPSDGWIIPKTVIIRDPWPESPSRQEISWEEFQKRAEYLLKMTYWREY
jgi:hypothetical protein